MVHTMHDMESTKFTEAVHPRSLTKNDGREKAFVVVTPVLNGEKFLNRAIESVIRQKGNFFIEYLIKDGGSNDNTISILESWCQRISLGQTPLNCKGLRFRVQSSHDNGLYDAVAQGFSLCPGSPYDVLTYINSDDVIIDGAFEIVEMLFNKIKAARWICGQLNVIDENDRVIEKPKFPLAYAREDILAGFHDGRSLYFIQQEGSFWTRELYDLVGGINRTLKLAGDFDLWRRFASQTELLALSINLGSFRICTGQLSSQLDKYYAEIDNLPMEQNNAITKKCFHKIILMEKLWSKFHIKNYFAKDDNIFWGGQKAFPRGKQQHPGPVCFLTEENRIHEIAYVLRTWYEW